MIITCKECSTSFNLDETLLKPSGSKVRCSNCQLVFTAYPPLEHVEAHPVADDTTEAESLFGAQELGSTGETQADLFAEALPEEDDLEFIESDLVFEIDDTDDDLDLDIEASLDEADDDLDLDIEASLDEADDDLDLDIEASLDEAEAMVDAEPVAAEPVSESLPPIPEPELEGLDAEEFDLIGLDEDLELDEDEDLDDTQIELTPEDLDLVKDFNPEAISELPPPSGEAGPDAQPGLDEIEFPEDGEMSPDEIDLSELTLNTEDLAPTAEPIETEVDEDLPISDEMVAVEGEPAEVLQDLDDQSDLEDQGPIEDLIDDDIDLMLDDFDEDGGPPEGTGDEPDLELELETQPEDADTAAEAPGRDEDDDLGLALEPEETVGEETLDDDLSLTLDLDASLAESVSGEEETETQEAADIDLDLEPEGDQDPSQVTDETVDDEDLDMDLDLDLEMELEEAAPTAADEGPDEDDDLGLALEPEETVGEETLDDDLNLTLDLDASLGDAITPEGETQEAADIDLDLELEGDPLQATAETGAQDSGEDELDLTMDLDETVSGEDGDEIDLDLDLDLELEEGPADAAAETDEVDLTLDFDDEPETEDQAADGSGDDLDLSDIEQMLSDDGQADNGKATGGSQEIEFNLDDDLDSSEGELDLSDIEDILDDRDEPAFADEAEQAGIDEQELTLDLDAEQAGADLSESTQDSLTADLDLSEFEYLADENETSPADDHFDAGDMELEFQVEEAAVEEAVVEEAPQPAAATPVETAPTGEDTLSGAPGTGMEVGGLTDEELFDDDEIKMAPAKKRGSSKFLIGLLIVLIIFGGAYCTYVLLEGMGIKIPFVSQLVKPKVQDDGNLHMSTFDINSKFIENNKAGRLFVVTGKVKNGYPETRGFIQLSGKLFTKGKQLAMTETVFGGNMLSDMELSSLEVEAIKKRLSVRFGDKKASMKVAPDKSLPFMVVFSNLPKAQLEEFTIEVVKSTALK